MYPVSRLFSIISAGFLVVNNPFKLAILIFIPSYDGRVILDGEFKNPMTYEIKEGELLSSILSLSGGFSEQAFKEKLYLERVGKYGFVSYSIPKSLMHLISALIH